MEKSEFKQKWDEYLNGDPVKLAELIEIANRSHSRDQAFIAECLEKFKMRKSKIGD